MATITQAWDEFLSCPCYYCFWKWENTKYKVSLAFTISRWQNPPGLQASWLFFLETISAIKSYDYGNCLGLYAAYSWSREITIVISCDMHVFQILLLPCYIYIFYRNKREVTGYCNNLYLSRLSCLVILMGPL